MCKQRSLIYLSIWVKLLHIINEHNVCVFLFLVTTGQPDKCDAVKWVKFAFEAINSSESYLKSILLCAQEQWPN